MCAYINRIQIHLSSVPQPSDQDVKVDFISNGQVFTSTAHAAGDAFVADMVSNKQHSRPSLASHSTVSSHDSCPDLFDVYSSPSRSSSASSDNTEIFSPAMSSRTLLSRTTSVDEEPSRFSDPFGTAELDMNKPSWSMESVTSAPRDPFGADMFPDFSMPTMQPFSFDWDALSSQDYNPIDTLSDFDFGLQQQPLRTHTRERSVSPAQSVCSQPSSATVTATAPETRIKNEMRLGVKRMKKLDNLMETLLTAPLPDLDEHNEFVMQLQTLSHQGAFQHRRIMSASSAEELNDTDMSNTSAKFAFDLLVWEKFRQEEMRLIHEDDLSPISASKEINGRMMKTRRRRSKTRDWASDGRKAANMFFDAVQTRGACESSFALSLLASSVSVDQMLKIAHFPILRSSFANRFARVVDRRTEEWRQLPAVGFAVMDLAQIVAL